MKQNSKEFVENSEQYIKKTLRRNGRVRSSAVLHISSFYFHSIIFFLNLSWFFSHPPRFTSGDAEHGATSTPICLVLVAFTRRISKQTNKQKKRGTRASSARFCSTILRFCGRNGPTTITIQQQQLADLFFENHPFSSVKFIVTRRHDG